MSSWAGCAADRPAGGARRAWTSRSAALAILAACAIAPASASAEFSSTRGVSKHDIRDEVTSVAPEVAAIVDDAINAVKPDGGEAPLCPAQRTDQAFARFGDAAEYFVAPGGDFEPRSEAWKLEKGAIKTPGNETAGVLRGVGSLTVRSGSLAISPEFCADASMPTFRFVARANQVLSSYEALVLYRDAAGTLTQATFLAANGQLRTPGLWSPSPISPLSTQIPLVHGGATASVQVVLRASSGSMSFDSVMIDPYRRG